MNRARRAGLVPWDAIRDDGNVVPEIPGWHGLRQFQRSIEQLAQEYFRTPIGDAYAELWVETAGMVPQLQSIANEFGVRVIGSGGFASTTQRYCAAQRLCSEARRCDVNPHVLMIGDYDPSGLSIMDSSCADVLAFSENFDVGVLFEHLAVTFDQALERNLESAPQKKPEYENGRKVSGDHRGSYMDKTYQAEALDPNDLASVMVTVSRSCPEAIDVSANCSSAIARMCRTMTRGDGLGRARFMSVAPVNCGSQSISYAGAQVLKETVEDSGPSYPMGWVVKRTCFVVAFWE